MKFLLCAVNAKYIHSNPAVYSLRSYAGEKWSAHIEIAEYTINQYADDILADIYGRRPDVIGFSCYIWNWTLVRELLCELPKVLPGVPLWLGGPEVTYDAPDVLRRYPQLAGIMVGEGEETFLELLEYYGEGSSDDRKALRDIPGLCLHDGPTAPRPAADMDRLPFPYREEDDLSGRIVYYESSRGCPFRCSYCLSSLEKKVRFRDIALVRQELQYFLDQGVRQVKFVDRTFNCDHERTMAVWEYLRRHDNGISNFHFEISADLLREEEIGLLSKLRPGLVQLEIGVQSVNPQTLAAIHRSTDLKKLAGAVTALKRARNVHLHLDLIAGLPFEDYDSFRGSFDWVYALRPEQLQLGFLKVLKGSEMRARAEEFGICCQSKPPYEVLYTNWLSYQDILRLKRVEEMVELYYNSNQYSNTLAVLEKAFPSPFAMYEALASFCREKGYFLNSPARAYRFRILFNFARRFDGEREELYRELLAYDMYLRENLKSRPDFLTGQEPYREEIREIYRKETAARELLADYQGYDARQLMRMTHTEYFRFPVCSPGRARDGAASGGRGWFVLFDYQRRDPLTSDAKVTVIERR